MARFSNFAFNCNLRHYTQEKARLIAEMQAADAAEEAAAA